MLDIIKIAIVDDHTLFRNGVTALLKEFKDIDVVFEAEDGVKMQQWLRSVAIPDIILMDINMPVMDGYKATAWLRTNHPQIKVLALSMFEDDAAVIKMIKCGAGGYVLKESKPAELLAAIKDLKNKNFFINDMLSVKLLNNLSQHTQEVQLSDKETEFLKLCCSELTYKEMADKMCVSPRTIDNYRESLFLKLELRSRTGLVLYAIQKRIFEWDQF